MSHLPLPALLNRRHKEEEAFKNALKNDQLSQIRTSDNYVENYEYIGSSIDHHYFKNIHDGNLLNCKK